MDKELNVVNIDNENYLIIKEVSKDNKTFLYLSNINNEEDTLIRKVDENDKSIVLPLENENEFELACNLLIKDLVN